MISTTPVIHYTIVTSRREDTRTPRPQTGSTTSSACATRAVEVQLLRPCGATSRRLRGKSRWVQRADLLAGAFAEEPLHGLYCRRQWDAVTEPPRQHSRRAMQGAAAISGSPGDAQGRHAVDTTVNTLAILNQLTFIPHYRTDYVQASIRWPKVSRRVWSGRTHLLCRGSKKLQAVLISGCSFRQCSPQHGSNCSLLGGRKCRIIAAVFYRAFDYWCHSRVPVWYTQKKKHKCDHSLAETSEASGTDTCTRLRVARNNCILSWLFFCFWGFGCVFFYCVSWRRSGWH